VQTSDKTFGAGGRFRKDRPSYADMHKYIGEQDDMFADESIDCFCGGYGLFIYYQKDKKSYVYKNFIRLFKLYVNYWIILLIIPVGFGLYLGTNSNYPSTFLNFILNF
jgi:hypothetical protein